MSETEHKMIEILRILKQSDKPIGSKIIADILQNKGYDLGERAVRYHLKILDEKGFTQRVGYSGREITELGIKELDKGLVYDQVNFIFSKFEETIFKTNFNYQNLEGNVIVNTSKLLLENNGLDTVKKAFEKGLAVSPLVDITEFEEDGKNYAMIKSICGTTIDGVLLHSGIPVIPKYGGLIKVEDNVPLHFNNLISLKETSIAPLEAFISSEMTSVLEVLESGNGIIPANFRLIPSSAKEKAEKIIKKLSKIGIGGVIKVGNAGEEVLGVPVREGLSGIAIVGGIAPFCTSLENHLDVEINLSKEHIEYNQLKPITNNFKSYLKPSDKHSRRNVQSVLSKAWNLMQNLDFNISTFKGNLITNISYLNSSDINEAIEIMGEVYKENKSNISPFYKIVDNPDHTNHYDKGIATICSLSVDGILIKNGIMSTPKFGGLLEIRPKPVFIELISYKGSSIDPHEIYIFQNMTNITNPNENKAILASVKEIPYVAREATEELIPEINKLGVPIPKFGKPQELVYNAVIDKYSFAIVTGSGLNPIAAVKEQEIDIKVKSVEGLSKFESMESLI